MNEKVDWMLGMSENMYNIANSNMDKPLMQELASMSYDIKNNLNQIKASQEIRNDAIDLMEQMMRNMEVYMMKMNFDDENQKMIMKVMMSYMIMMQLTAMRG